MLPTAERVGVVGDFVEAGGDGGRGVNLVAQTWLGSGSYSGSKRYFEAYVTLLFSILFKILFKSRNLVLKLFIRARSWYQGTWK